MFGLTFTAEEIDYLDTKAEGLDGSGADVAHGGLPGTVEGSATHESPRACGPRSPGSAA